MPSFLNAMTRQIPSSSIHAATQKAEAYRREGKKVVIFSIGRPDFDTPAHIKEAAKAALDKGYVHYTPNMGILPLREAVAEHIKRQTGVSYDPKTEVMITCGGQQAILLTMKAVLEPGDEVLLPSPGYGLYYNCAAIADAQVRAYALKAPDFGWGGAEAGERTKMLFINRSPISPRPTTCWWFPTKPMTACCMTASNTVPSRPNRVCATVPSSSAPSPRPIP